MGCRFRLSLMVISLSMSLAAAWTPCELSAQNTPNKQRWTIAQALEERKLLAITKKPKYCQKGRFAPCVCPKDVPSIVQYRPSVKECGGKAAIILSGKYKDIFSVVVRDRDNKDRWPPEGISGCTAYERDVLALNKCSAFKAHKVLQVDDPRGDASVHCLGANGYSRFFKRVVRMTAKITDIPNSTADPLARWCLLRPGEPLN